MFVYIYIKCMISKLDCLGFGGITRSRTGARAESRTSSTLHPGLRVQG